MAIVTRPAGKEDAEALARFWQTHMNPRHGIERWRTIADCPWYGDPPNHGWIAVDDGRIVGTMALVHSVRRINGSIEKLCNIGSLYVLKPYRGRGLARAIARESTADPSTTYIGIDAAPQTRAVLEPEPVGFEILDDKRYLWRPGVSKRMNSLCIQAGEAFDTETIDGPDRELFQDHLGLRMHPLRLRRDGRECRALLWIRNKHSDTTYFEALYLSDPKLFAQCAAAVATNLVGNGNGVLAADSRYFHDAPAGAETETLRQPRHFKSRRLAPADIDLLYSEVPLLDLKLS